MFRLFADSEGFLMFLRIKGVLQLLADLLAHLVGKAELQLREHLLVENRPHQLIVEVALAFTLAALLPPVLDIEEAEVQRYEVVNGVATAGDLRHRGRVVGKAAQLPRAHLEGPHCRAPGLVEFLHAFLHRLVNELLPDQ